MTAASNKFLRRYYAPVRDYLATLDDLPPVDMDSTGLKTSDGRNSHLSHFLSRHFVAA